jgi:hypothetical protein
MPVVYAGKPVKPDPPPLAIVMFNDEDASTIIDPLTGELKYNVTVTPLDDKLPDDWNQIGKVYEITVDPLPTEPTVVEVWILLPTKYQHGNKEVTIVQFGLPADFDVDGDVDGQDIKLIANANSQPDLYEWRFDLDQSGYITDEDVSIANYYKGWSPFWDALPTIKEYNEDYNEWYALAPLWHFSRFGIR